MIVDDSSVETTVAVFGVTDDRVAKTVQVPAYLVEPAVQVKRLSSAAGCAISASTQADIFERSTRVVLPSYIASTAE